MDAGRPPPSRTRLWVRRVVGGLLVLVVGLPLLPSLFLRGPVLRWLVARASRGLCGTVQVEGGHVGWLVAADLWRARPFAVELRGVRITGADGGEALFVAHVSGEVQVSRHPWRLVVDDAVAEHGRWRLVIDRTGGLGGLLGAFRPVPAGETRAACLQPPAPRGPPRGPAPAPVAASVAVHEARLEDIDVDLDFPVWGLSLPHAHGRAWLALSTAGGPLFTFDVRDAHAPSGVLRVGPGGAAATAATTTARFDDVIITRVGVSPDEPANLVLEVGHADTGRSRLAGHAVFENVFPHHGRRGEKHLPGLVLDAHWDRLRDAVARVDAPWLPREALGEILDGALAARVRGPFLALSGAVSLEGPRAGIEATVERGERATLDARATDLALAPFLHESLQPLLAGRVSGHLRAKVELVAGFRNADLEIPDADVTLTRDGAAPQPRRIAFRVGVTARKEVPWGEKDDTLVLGLTAARLFHRTLRVEGMSARWAELSARGALTLEMPGPSKPTDAVHASAASPGARLAVDRPASAERAAEPPARIDAKITMSVASLARWVPPTTATARVAAEATLTGPLDHLRARLAFAPATTATIFGERFLAPAPVTATLDDGRAVTVSGLSIAHVGGGRVEFHGSAARAGRVAGELRISDYPLAALPGLDSVVMPPVLTGGRAATLHQSIGGTLNATLDVAGASANPAYTGTLDLEGVTLVGRRIGDGHLHARARGWTVALDGTLGSGLALDVGATRRPDGISGDANLKLEGFALGPWLPPALAGLDAALSGVARVAFVPHRPPVTHADLQVVGALGQLALRGSGTGGVVEGTVRGRVELAGLRPLWKRDFAQADGAVTLDVSASPRAPLTGTLVVARALTLRPAGWPLAVGVAEGGRIDVDGTRVHVPGLALTAAGSEVALAGDVQVDAAVPERSIIALTAKARLDAGALARQAHLPALASARGTIVVDARATGPARAPLATGTARFDDVEVRPRAAAWPTLRVSGVVEANGHAVSTRALRIDATGGFAEGAVTVGAPDAAASVDLSTAWPPRVDRVDLPLSARGLRIGDARSPLAIGALDLHLRLAGDPERELVLSGDVGVARARVNPFGGKRSKSGPARPWFEGLPPRLTLDVTLHGPDDAVVVAVPVLPDIDIGFRCHVAGSARGGTISGQVRGGGPYSRLMLALFGPKGTRECRVLKE